MAGKRFARRVKDIDISGIRKMFESAGPGAINLGLGQPDFDTPSHIKEAAICAIREGFTGYTPGPGILELRTALCEKFKNENGLEFSPSEIIVTSGASEALEIALACLVEPGDEVLIPDPGFVSYKTLTTIMGAKAVPVPLEEDLTLSPQKLTEYIGPATRAFIVNSPANPTGAVQSPEDMKAFSQIADDHNITMICDEVYEHFIYEGRHVSPALYSDNVITVNAVSKTYAMTGWRLGYVAARDEYIQQMLKIHQYVQACANSIAQKAAVAAVGGSLEPVITMREEFRKRRNVLVEGLNSIGLDCALPGGAFYAFPYAGDDYPDIVSELISSGVIVVPGSAFGSNGSGHIRISYAASMDDIKQALDIMEKTIRC
ncbi:pyridoxal phosphate-dependent aminotransferase [Methanosalsum zhilinae]|nr:pyridoxal phosphate-dependent aminotransferase [Methanosalsum zhilinae]